MSESSWCPVDLSAATADVPSRGGATMININNVIYMFGGANRGQTNFCDLWVLKEEDGDTQFKCVECEGDVPMPRSDHAVVGYDGRFLLLFGGKNYEAEECYSDLYILDLASFEWWYVGEAGEELQVRCGHSLALLRAGDARHLVVFGGSSPEIGTCSADTYFAVLPPASEIGVLKDFFVTWQKLGGAGPAAREMHGSAQLGESALFVCGGMSQAQPKGLSDVWLLAAATPAQEGQPSLRWRRCADLELPTPLCGHCCSVSAGAQDRVLLCSMGGISGGDCIVEDMLCADVTPHLQAAPAAAAAAPAAAGQDSIWLAAQWRNTAQQPVHFRMGLCFLGGGVPAWLYSRHVAALPPVQSARARRNARKKKNRRAKKAGAGAEDEDEAETAAAGEVGEEEQGEEEEVGGEPDETSSAADTAAGEESSPAAATVVMSNCALLFGGVDQQTDHHDLWLFHCHAHILGVPGSRGAASGTDRSGLVSVLC